MANSSRKHREPTTLRDLDIRLQALENRLDEVLRNKLSDDFAGIELYKSLAEAHMEIEHLKRKLSASYERCRILSREAHAKVQ